MVEDATIGSYIVAPSRGIGNNDITSACSAYNQLNCMYISELFFLTSSFE